MQRRRLGGDGPEVSAIGVGAMSFAGIYGRATEDEAHAVLAAALDLGIDHIDTANVYGGGLSERMVGSFLARQGKARDGLFRIATKAGIRHDPESGRRGFDNSPAHLAAELEGSLKRLGLDAVDLFYVHRRDPEVPIEEVAGALAGLVQAGKARAFGFSEIAPSSLRRAAGVHPVAAVQSEYSLSTRAPELGLVQACAALGTALVAFSPVGRALLTDRPPTPERIAASDFLRSNPRFTEPALAANLALAAGFGRLAADMGTSAAALAIAWLLASGPGVIAIPGTRSPAHLAELAAGAGLRLSAADIDRIEATLPVGWAHGDRYSPGQWVGPERYS
ncbi:MAG TPA: aldo/keto reductase [Amaricoccus sp.]|nr:aldo/keto reductase [Amaricoccus sp.]